MLGKQMLSVLPSNAVLSQEFCFDSRVDSFSNCGGDSQKQEEPLLKPQEGSVAGRQHNKSSKARGSMCEVVTFQKAKNKDARANKEAAAASVLECLFWLLISATVTYAAEGLREPRASLLLGQVAVLASGWLCARAVMAGSR